MRVAACSVRRAASLAPRVQIRAVPFQVQFYRSASGSLRSEDSETSSGRRLRDRLSNEELLGDSAAIKEYERRKREDSVRRAWKSNLVGTMSPEELHEGILMYFKYRPTCPDKWLRLLLRTVQTPAHYYMGLDCYLLYLRRGANVSEDREISSLLLGAAVRCGIPDAGLKMLGNVWGFRFFPGNHSITRLLRTFSVRKDKFGVEQTWNAIRERHLEVGAVLGTQVVASHVTVGNPRAAVEIAIELLSEGVVLQSQAASLAMRQAKALNDVALEESLSALITKHSIPLRPWVNDPLDTPIPDDQTETETETEEEEGGSEFAGEETKQ